MANTGKMTAKMHISGKMTAQPQHKVLN